MGIVATVGANLAHGVGHGPVGALVSAWPALALVGSFELLMTLIRAGRGTLAGDAEPEPRYQPAPPLAHEAPLELAAAPTLEQTVHAHYEAGWRASEGGRRGSARFANLRHKHTDRCGHSQRGLGARGSVDQSNVPLDDVWPRPVTVSKKSQASRAPAWERRKLAQVAGVRSGAGSIPACCRISHTVEAATLMPSTSSPPWMRR